MSFINRVYVDLDGTLSDSAGTGYNPKHIAKPFDGAKKFMEDVKELSNVDEIYIYSCRTSNWVQGPVQSTANMKVIKVWLEKWEIPYDGIFCGDGKPDGLAFVDGRGVPCRPRDNPSHAYDAALYRIKRLVSPNAYNHLPLGMAIPADGPEDP